MVSVQDTITLEQFTKAQECPMFKSALDFAFLSSVSVGVVIGKVFIFPIIALDKLCKPFVDNGKRVGISHMGVYQ